MKKAKLIGMVVLLLACGAAGDTPKVTPATAQEVLLAVRRSGAKVVLVNLWASWCGPCREEFPSLLKIQKEFAPQGLKVIFVSWDEKTADAVKFLTKQGVDSPSFIKDDKQTDQIFAAALERKWTGGLPSTFIYNGKGKLIQFWEDKADYDKFKAAVQAALTAQSTVP